MSVTTKLMPLTIDGKRVEVPEGTTVLEAARRLGINIPTLCYLSGVKEDRPSCLACVVRVGDEPRLVPACSTRVTDGMVVASETAEVRSARKAALELLFSDHLGDCVPVCQRVCPANLQIPVVIRLVAAGRMKEAIAQVKEHIVFPGVLGRICRAPCQTGFRRSQHDGPVAIQLIEREVADADLATADRYQPTCDPPTGRRVAIVGAGATGLSAAFYLLRRGHRCLVIDDHAEPGGTLRYGVPETDLPRPVLEGDIEVIRRIGLEFQGNSRLGRDQRIEDLRAGFDAVVLAVGRLEQTDPTGLGVEATGRAVRINPANCETSIAGVFAGGGCVRAGYEPARSVADGRMLADCVDGFLRGDPVQLGPREFTSTIPRLSPEEYQELTKGSNATLSVRELIGVAEEAAGRCCHCDCRSANNCRLRTAAELYEVDPKAYAGGRRRSFEFIRQPAGVIFEPGKCITCGICVEIAAQSREPLGLTFIGRGFDVRVGVPLGRSLDDALQLVAEECVRHCPTGALAFEQDNRNAVKE